jgi:H+/Cl- antiporter ClcA
MNDSTSTQRTHRYLRIAIGGTVVVIFAAMLAAVPTVGWLASISDYFYTPARNAFVGALIAASLALLALSVLVVRQRGAIAPHGADEIEMVITGSVRTQPGERRE